MERDVSQETAKLESLRTVYKKEVERLNTLGYTSIAIFGVPAIGVVIGGNYFVAEGFSKASTYSVLSLCALCISGIVFYVLFTKIQKRLSVFEKDIHDLALIVEPRELHD